MLDVKKKIAPLVQFMLVKPEEYDDFRTTMKRFRFDSKIRIVSTSGTTVLMIWLDYQVIAAVFFGLVFAQQLVAWFCQSRCHEDPHSSPNYFDLYAWNSMFGFATWTGLALALCATKGPMEIVLGFTTIFGVLANLINYFTHSKRMLVSAIIPVAVSLLAIPFVLFGDAISSREFVATAIGCLLTLFYAASATIGNARLTHQLVLAREEAEALAKSKSEFLASMSHEIRTPMNGILGFAELLKKSELEDRQKEFVDTIHSSGSALLAILNDILDFSKAEAGKIELDPAPFDIRSAIEDVAALLSTAAHDKEIELLVRLSPDLPRWLVGDVGRFRQVLTNIVGNAIKFTHEGHVLVDVSAEKTSSTALLKVVVQDTGIGIPSDKIRHIFENFTQAESSTTRTFGGTGLGLAISSQLIEKMAGKILVNSIHGEGSTFEILLELPIDDSQEQPVKQSQHLAITDPVIIVDDNRINRRILEEQLQVWGIKSVGFERGQEAIDYLVKDYQGGAAPIVLLDYHMPEMDGLAFLSALRRNPKISSARVIVLSSVDGKDVFQDFKALDVVDIAPKPIRMDMLNGLLRKATQVDTQQSIVDSECIALEERIEQRSKDGDGLVDVLVAEDNEMNQRLLRHMIDSSEFNLTFVSNGVEALDRFRHQKFHIILMDISMPKMDGIETTKAIRSLEASQNLERVPIIALTAHSMPGDRGRFENAGMDDYIPKPIPPKRLHETLSKWRAEDVLTDVVG